MSNEPGRPPYTNEQYNKWLDDLRPFLKLGETLGEAVQDAGLSQHRTTLYEKYRLKDDFSYWIDTWRAYPGKPTLMHLISLNDITYVFSMKS